MPARSVVSHILHVATTFVPEVVDCKGLVFRVNHRHCFFNGFEGKHRQQASKDFFFHDVRVLFWFQDDRWFDVSFIDVGFAATDDFTATRINQPFESLCVELVDDLSLERR
jgi:hypothetical protein